MRISGERALIGWRERVADVVAGPADRHTPLDRTRVRALIGWAFFVLSVAYVVRTVRSMGR
jgi:hypothetical protein